MFRSKHTVCDVFIYLHLTWIRAQAAREKLRKKQYSKEKTKKHTHKRKTGQLATMFTSTDNVSQT